MGQDILDMFYKAFYKNKLFKIGTRKTLFFFMKRSTYQRQNYRCLELITEKYLSVQLMNFPKFTTNLYCICLSIDFRYT